ncbi:MAG: hypothetical protein JWO82_1425 [Akkermansiaceae bacterium]|nr:hypothetical protein [Akkermansiaceae bacterium]
MKTLNLAIAGCGAITETYHAPALVELARAGIVRVSALFDPEPARLAAVLRFFPEAKACATLAELILAGAQAAIVASPPRFHGEQTCALLEAGLGVLCEKPMAISTSDAEKMAEVARRTGKPLAIGLLRRFFPALQAIKDLVQDRALGEIRSFSCPEGGAFGWPAQSPSLFQKAASGGGVLLDVGVHVLDLVQWWFGEPMQVEYSDDAMGGLEANCEVKLTYSGFGGSVRLSRDTPLANRYTIDCEHGKLAWDVMQANHFDLTPTGAKRVLRCESFQPSPLGREKSPALSSGTFYSSFIDQLRNFLAAVRGEAELSVSGEEGLKSMRLIERCYNGRRLIEMPWLSATEGTRARRLSGSI